MNQLDQMEIKKTNSNCLELYGLCNNDCFNNKNNYWVKFSIYPQFHQMNVICLDCDGQPAGEEIKIGAQNIQNITRKMNGWWEVKVSNLKQLVYFYVPNDVEVNLTKQPSYKLRNQSVESSVFNGLMHSFLNLQS